MCASKAQSETPPITLYITHVFCQACVSSIQQIHALTYTTRTNHYSSVWPHHTLHTFNILKV